MRRKMPVARFGQGRKDGLKARILGTQKGAPRLVEIADGDGGLKFGKFEIAGRIDNSGYGWRGRRCGASPE